LQSLFQDPIRKEVAPNAEKLVELLQSQPIESTGQSLILAGNLALTTIPNALENMQCSFTKIVVYETIPHAPKIDLENLLQKHKRVFFCFFSPSGVNTVLSAFPSLTTANDQIQFISLGKTTTAAFSKWNVKKVVTASSPSAIELVKCIE